MSPGLRNTVLATPPVRMARGALYPLRAARTLLGSRRMLLWALVPFALGLLLYVLFFAAFLYYLRDLASLVLEAGAWWRTVLRVLLMTGLTAGLAAAAVFTYAGACLIIAGPVYEYLSCAAEANMTGRVREEPFTVRRALGDMWHALVITTFLLWAELAVLLAGLLFVPITTALAAGASAWLLALEQMDYPMARRRMPLCAKLAWARRHRWEMVGLGLPVFLGIMIPFAGAAFLPVGVVAATALFLDLEHEPVTPTV